MTAHLPPSLLALFAPRPPIPFMPPVPKNELPTYSGVADFLNKFEDPELNPEAANEGRDPFETKKKRKKRILRERVKKRKLELDDKVKTWDPQKDPKATGDPYRTLFVGKMNYNTTEHKLKREFEIYGPIKRVRVVQDQNGKPRGYAFIEYEKERDMKNAYKQADGKKIDGRRVLVDIERGRTIRGWRPRKYGGGLGYSRATSEDREQMRRDRDSSHGERSRDRERDKDRHRDRGERDSSRSDRGDRDKERPDREKRDYQREEKRPEKRPRSRERERERER